MGLILERSFWFIPNGIYLTQTGPVNPDMVDIVSVTILTPQAEQKMSDTDRKWPLEFAKMPVEFALGCMRYDTY